MVSEFLPNQKWQFWCLGIHNSSRELVSSQKKKPKQKFTSNPNKKLEVDEKGFQSNKKFWNGTFSTKNFEENNSIKKGRLGLVPVLELVVVTSSSAGLDSAGEISSSSEEREKPSSVSTWKAATS